MRQSYKAVHYPAMRRPTPMLALLLAIAACRGESVRTAVSDTTGAPQILAGSSAGAIVLQLWQLRDSMTLGEWKSARPDEPVSDADTSAMSSQLGEWCAASQQQATVGARTVTRTAFFYAPPAPPGLALPDSVPDLVRQCRLGLMWVRIEVPDSVEAAALADSVSTQLAGIYGPAVPGRIHFWGSALWRRSSRFARGDITALSGLRVPPAATTPGASPVVFAFAFLPASGVSVDAAPVVSRYEPVDILPIDSAAALVGADSLFAPLRALLRVQPAGAPSPTPQQLIVPLRRWLQGTAGLPVPRRAAAFYVADQTLERLLCTHQMCDLTDQTSRAPLEALGAEFSASELGGTWVYTHNWLATARALERDSPLGQRLLLAQMARAFDFSGTCAEGAEGFRRVIANGETYLARVPASPIAADVHFQLAEAYRDIIALARGAGDIYADSSRYGAEAGPAALKALEHYRAAMRIAPAAPVAEAAWRRAWWLKAGLVPRDLRFYCVYD